MKEKNSSIKIDKIKKFLFKSLIFIIGIPLLAFVLLIIFDQVGAFQLRDNINRGGTIVKAIENYYNTEKKYPDNLNNLVPVYIKKIPISKFGAWEYGKYGKEGVNMNLLFQYHIFLGGQGNCSYNSETKNWRNENY